VAALCHDEATQTIYKESLRPLGGPDSSLCIAEISECWRVVGGALTADIVASPRAKHWMYISVLTVLHVQVLDRHRTTKKKIQADESNTPCA
jgi:hypothetical protein